MGRRRRQAAQQLAGVLCWQLALVAEGRRRGAAADLPPAQRCWLLMLLLLLLLLLLLVGRRAALIGKHPVLQLGKAWGGGAARSVNVGQGGAAMSARQQAGR